MPVGNFSPPLSAVDKKQKLQERPSARLLVTLLRQAVKAYACFSFYETPSGLRHKIGAVFQHNLSYAMQDNWSANLCSSQVGTDNILGQISAGDMLNWEGSFCRKVGGGKFLPPVGR